MNKILTPEFRAAFVSVFKPKGIKGDPNAKEKYSVVMLFPKDADLKDLKAAAEAAAKAKWGGKVPPKLKTPFKDQKEAVNGDGDQYAGFGEGIYIQASSDTQPGIVDAKVKDIIDDKDFYSGCYARATVNAYAWEHPTGGKGISFGLLNIQKLRDGDRLGGGRAKPTDDFQPVEGANDGDGEATADALFG
jgi:hypothetical protein